MNMGLADTELSPIRAVTGEEFANIIRNIIDIRFGEGTSQ